MTEDLQSWILLLLIGCILMLAAINIYLVILQIKSTRGAVSLPTKSASQQTSPAYERHMEHVAGQLNLIQTALEEIKTQAPAAEAESDGEAEVDTSPLFQLDSELSESLVQLEQADGGTEKLLLDLQQTKADGLSAWRDLNADRIAELVKQQKQLRGRIVSLQNLLSESNATILTLRSRPRRNFSPAADLANDKAMVADLQEARKSAARLTSELSAANANVQMLNERVTTRELMLAEAGEQHEKERVSLDAQIAELKAKIQSLQASHDRTLVEKNFIEDAFLEEIEGEKKTKGSV